MKTITEVYDDYLIVINLQEHQRRVAAVAKLIAENFSGELDRNGVIEAALLHDMGNIIKFNQDHFREGKDLDDETFLANMKNYWLTTFGPNEDSAEIFVNSLRRHGRDYWIRVKADFKAKYGSDEHAATLAIARELGRSPAIISYLQNVGFDKLDMTVASKSFEQKICAYADMRVAINGVTTIAERLNDARRRYQGSAHSIVSEKYERLEKALYDIEEQIQARTNIALSSISDETVIPQMEKLKGYILSEV